MVVGTFGWLHECVVEIETDAEGIARIAADADGDVA